MTSKRLTRAQAIKKYCKESCCAMDRQSWVKCSVINCPLWRYRRGGECKPPKNDNLLKKGQFYAKKNENKGAEVEV